MTSVEKLLVDGLQQDPTNWDVRIKLAEKLLAQDQAQEAADLISTAEGCPSDEEQLHRALEIVGGHTTVGNWDTILTQFSLAHPTSGYAHRILASHYLLLADLPKSRKHYTAAVTLEPSYEDSAFESHLVSQETLVAGEASDDADASRLQEQEEAKLVTSMVAIPTETGVVALKAEAGDEDSENKFRATDEDYPITFETDSLEDPVEKSEPAIPDVDEASAMPLPEVLEDHSIPESPVASGSAMDVIAPISFENPEVQAAIKNATRNSKFMATVVAIVVHVLVIGLLIWIKVAEPPPPPPQIIGTAIPSDLDEDQIEQVKLEKVKVDVSAQSASTEMQVTTAFAMSSFAVPEFDSTAMTFEPLGMGDNFGPSMSFAGEDGGGMVSFFGSKTNATKVVFVVDASGSMKSTGKTGRSKFDLMKEELTRTVKSLPPGVEFQILFFSGPSWFIGEYNKKQAQKEWKRQPAGNFWEYLGGNPDKWPEVKYLKSTPSTIRKVTSMIQDTPMVNGTDWRDPLKMAMNMEPDVIYFMTDGAVGSHPDKKPVVDDVLDFNRAKSRAKINSICFMVLNAYEKLKTLADRTRGEFTLVTENGQILRGREVDDLASKMKNNKKN